MALVKICGLVSVEDAVACADLGAHAIGVNFVSGSPRRVDAERARAIARAVHAAHPKVVIVGIVADLDIASAKALAADAELDCLQLHGAETPETLAALLPHAYKAVRIGSPADVAHARSFPGAYVLVDAKVDGALGGTGEVFDWTWVAELARERKLTLAGGLRPDNVEAAVRAVRPYCVDVASGVEHRPGEKDLVKVAAFVRAARAV